MINEAPNKRRASSPVLTSKGRYHDGAGSGSYFKDVSNVGFSDGIAEYMDDREWSIFSKDNSRLFERRKVQQLELPKSNSRPTSPIRRLVQTARSPTSLFQREQQVRPASSPSKRSTSSPYKDRSFYSPMGSPKPVRNHPSHDIQVGPNTPGPGNYQPNYSALLPKSPASSIPSAKRFYSPRTSYLDSPGPSAYNPKLIDEAQNPIGWRMSFGKAERFEKEKRSQSPTHSYNPNFDVVLPSAPGVIFPKQKREKEARSVTPGPGYYNSSMLTTRSPSVSFGSAKRSALENTCAAPGPGNYRPEEAQNRFSKLSKSPSFSFGHSKKDTLFERRAVSPGPTKYNPNYSIIQNTTPGCSFGKEKRKSTSRSTTPSVLDYNPNTSPVNKSTPAFSFGKAKSRRGESSTVSPGPGNYYPNTSIVQKQSTAFSFPRAKELSQKRPSSPGPKYNVQAAYTKIRDSQLSPSFTKAKRETTRRSETPGPAYYRVEQSSSNSPKGVTIGKSKRFVETQSFTPAPTAYNPHPVTKGTGGPTSFYKQSRGITLGRKDVTPGPADYHVSDSFVKSRTPTAVLGLTG